MIESVPFSDTVRSFMDFLWNVRCAAGNASPGWGLSMPQFSIIMQLHFHGSCSVSDISERFETTSARGSVCTGVGVFSVFVSDVESNASVEAEPFQRPPLD